MEAASVQDEEAGALLSVSGPGRPRPALSPLPWWQTNFRDSDETLCKFCYSVMIINHYSLKHFSRLEPQPQIILSF